MIYAQDKPPQKNVLLGSIVCSAKCAKKSVIRYIKNKSCSERLLGDPQIPQIGPDGPIRVENIAHSHGCFMSCKGLKAIHANSTEEKVTPNI